MTARKVLGDIIIDLAERPLPPGLAELCKARNVTIPDALTLGWAACLIALKHEYTRLYVTEDDREGFRSDQSPASHTPDPIRGS